MKIKISLYLFILLMLSSFFVGCSSLPYGNKAPVIDSNPLTSIKVEQLYIYKVNGNDTENDGLTYSLLAHPEGMTIDPLNGNVNWLPTSKQTGAHEVTINVRDKWRNDTQNFTIEVSEILLTSIDATPEAITLFEASFFTFNRDFLKVTAHYDYGPSKEISLTECIFQSDNTNIATVNNSGVVSGISEGLATITVNYTENGITKNDNVKVIVSKYLPCNE